MTLSEFHRKMVHYNEQLHQWQSTINHAVHSHDRKWLLESARHVFFSLPDDRWPFLEAFRPAIETASSAEAREWADIFLTRLQFSHQFPDGVQGRRLTWFFFEHLGQHHFPEQFRQMIYGSIPTETDSTIFRALSRCCKRFPGEIVSWGPLLSARADIELEPNEDIRQIVWQTFADSCREHPDSSSHDPDNIHSAIWNITGDIFRRAIIPPGERSPLVVAAAMDYLTATSPALFFQLWNDIQLRVDPHHESDWMLRQCIWESLETQNGSIKFQIQMTAYNLIDHHLETHPAVLRQLSVYGQQLG